MGKPDRMEPYLKRTKRLINMDKRKHCGRKEKHGTIEAATNHARILMMKDGRHASGYKCRYCRYYHAGHTPVHIMVAMFSEALERPTHGD